MSVIDLLTRVDAICQKYDKYDVEKQRDSNISGDDAFARLYSLLNPKLKPLISFLTCSLFSVDKSRKLFIFPK